MENLDIILRKIKEDIKYKSEISCNQKNGGKTEFNSYLNGIIDTIDSIFPNTESLSVDNQSLINNFKLDIYSIKSELRVK